MTLSDGLTAVALPFVLAATLLSACTSDHPGITATTGVPTSTMLASTTVDTRPEATVSTAPPRTSATATLNSPTTQPTQTTQATQTQLPALERVLTVGDGVMFDLEPALAASLAPAQLRPRAYLGSGLSNPEHFDWITQWPSYLDSRSPDDGPVQLVIVLLGVWDARTVTVEGVELIPGTPTWATWYRNVVTTAATTLAAGGAHVVWILPLTEPDPAKASRLAAVEAVIIDVVGTIDGQEIVDGDVVLAGAANRYASHDDHGDRLRKNDGEHLCPAGAIALAEAVRTTTNRWFTPATADGTTDTAAAADDWRSGAWRTDPRYTRPEEGCAS
ncbi:MAG: hypothetical protein AB7V43_13340 [Acidimicrobiia bacterium]